MRQRSAQSSKISEFETWRGKFTAAAGTATLPVATSDKVARGTIWIETGHGATAPLGAGRVQAGRA